MYGGCAIQTPVKKHSLARRESLCGLLSVLPAVVMEIAACGYQELYQLGWSVQG